VGEGLITGVHQTLSDLLCRTLLISVLVTSRRDRDQNFANISAILRPPRLMQRKNDSRADRSIAVASYFLSKSRLQLFAIASAAATDHRLKLFPSPFESSPASGGCPGLHRISEFIRRDDAISIRVEWASRFV